VERVPIQRLLKDADPAVNFVLRGGEEIRVPEAGKIFVVGNVQRPGAFPLTGDGEASVLRMVALSEGLLPYAAKIAYIYRRGDDGAKHEIPVEIEKIMERKAPDVTLQVDDVLYIPDNKTRRTTMNVIDRITSFGASTASGVLVWRR
jgi:polysaccharide export outer membrane protein